MNESIIEYSQEKYLKGRFADIYFKFNNNQEAVVEIQNSYISVSEIKKRTEDYNKLGINVLWILYAEGKCVGSYKYPKDTIKTRISTAENYLFQMYGGRVYYVNLRIKRKLVSISDIFALYFSKPIKRSKRRLFKTRYSYFYLRDSIHTPIKNWKLLCTRFAGNKIARFYDKNVKGVLKSQIKSFYEAQVKLNTDKKKIIKLLISKFKKKYGLFLIYKSIIELHNEKYLNFNEKIIKKIQKKVS
jgi:competence CoiA-like predicted nuclease